MLAYQPTLQPNARKLRHDLTEAERRLWHFLRSKQLGGLQFYRQKPIGRHIVDFYCAAAKLVVEVDGGQHFEDTGIAADRQRDTELTALGLRVLRFDNRQVLAETVAVVEEIGRVVAERIAPKATTGTAKSPPAPLLPPLRGVSGLAASPQRGEEDSVPPFAKGGKGGIFGAPLNRKRSRRRVEVTPAAAVDAGDGAPAATRPSGAADSPPDGPTL